MSLPHLPTITHGLPNICGHEKAVETAVANARHQRVFAHDAGRLDGVRAAAGIALHMHQPTIPGGGARVETASLINYLQYMYENPGVGDNHNAGPFENCYNRIADFIRELHNAGRSPRVMLDYSGNLLWGLEAMGKRYVLDNLRDVTCSPTYNRYVEWLGTMWSHAVASNTPPPDLKLHMRAWQHHFATIFGWEAMARVKGFSPPEMHLPNHPDTAFVYVTSLRECGYKYLLVQEHTVELPEGGGLRERHLPARLVCRNSRGESASITAIIKTQGSDTKLVAQMQPLYEARGLQRRTLAGKSVPPFVFQIGDGENGGVMMNEFPAGYKNAVHGLTQDVPLLNALEYLECLESLGLNEADFPAIQPIHQARLFSKFAPGTDAPDKLPAAIQACRKEDHRFHMEGGSWTNDRSWVAGYEGVIHEIDKLSIRFHEVMHRLGDKINSNEHRYRNALLHLLLAETSCFRYWGGNHVFTTYARELCRRGHAILDHDF